MTDWPKLAEMLRARRGPVSRVWEFLPKKAQEAIADDTAVGQLGDPLPMERAGMLKASVKLGLRSMLKRHDFFDADKFKKLELGKEAEALSMLGTDRTPFETLRLNRAVLAALFPKVITEPPPDYHVVRVTVKAGADVILVLSSYETCRWEVELSDGASVKGVILCGVMYQEVAKIEAPIVYRAATGRDGKVTGGEWFNGHDKKEPEFEKMARGIKELTGRPFTSFQGQYTAPKDGFIVQPGKK